MPTFVRTPSPKQHVVVGDFGDLLENSPSSLLLENQLQAAIRAQQYLIEQLIRDSVYQVEFWAKQAQASQAVQATAVNAFAARGLSDVSQMKRIFEQYKLDLVAVVVVEPRRLNQRGLDAGWWRRR